MTTPSSWLGLFPVLFLFAACGGTNGQPDAGKFDALSCPEVAGTPETLKEKAERYDALAQSLHIPAGQDQLYSVRLKEDLATLEMVAMSDNVGTWTGLYSASQAYRYAATKDPKALDNLRRSVKGEQDMLRITGVPGLFTRIMVNPALPGFPSAAQLAAWYPDCDLSVAHCKRFNEVTAGEFSGWWFKNDVSKDEYAAHLFAMSVVLDVVDDPEVRERASAIATAVGDHLIEHNLKLTDIDGKVTTYGRLTPMSFDDFPGFNALLALSWIKIAAVAGGDKYREFYEGCLLQQHGTNPCVHDPDEDPVDYSTHLTTAGVGLNLNCGTNWNNHNMAQLGMAGLIALETDPDLLAIYRKALREALWDAEPERPMRVQQKVPYTFFYLVHKDPADPWPEQEAKEALCVMKTFPTSKEHYPVDNFADYAAVCTDRSDEPITDVVIPIPERGMDNFVWINNPYKLEQEPGDPRQIESPEDYLLAYWMGRYYGFFREDM
jgi:hypothetical protein